MDIRNKATLKSALSQILEDVIDDVIHQFYDILRESIMTNTYKYGGENRWYYNGMKKPTFQFYNAWKILELRRNVNSLSRSVVYDYSKMDYDKDTWLHGSIIGGDARKNLADILNNPFRGDGFRTSSLMINGRYFSKQRLPFFDMAIDEIDEKMDNIITASFVERGFTVV